MMEFLPVSAAPWPSPTPGGAGSFVEQTGTLGTPEVCRGIQTPKPPALTHSGPGDHPVGMLECSSSLGSHALKLLYRRT